MSLITKRYRFIKSLYQQRGITLREYQLNGIYWMMKLEDRKLGGILADEPGLGKTYQSLALALSSKGKTLVIVPSSILQQWYKDAVFLKSKKSSVYLHHGKSRLREFPPHTKIVITTPCTLLISGCGSVYVNLHDTLWKRIIFDEAHLMKNKDSVISKCAIQLKAEYKWALTGTPVQNRPAETVNLFRFVYNLSDDDDVVIDLKSSIQHQLLRRTKKQYLDLPALSIENCVIDFDSQEERQFYHKVRKDVKTEFMNISEMCMNPAQLMSMMFELLLRMRQTSIHPQLVIEGYRKKYGKTSLKDWSHCLSSKHNKLIELIQEHPQDSSIVFCQFTQEIKLLEPLFQQKGWRVERIDGEQRDKQGIIDRCQSNSLSRDYLYHGLSKTMNCFRQLPQHLLQYMSDYSPKIDIVLIQIKAGGVGLNLQKFNRIYFTSPDWNPTNEIQAIARAHRFGQDKKVYVKNILLEDSLEPGTVIDNRLLATQDDKRKLSAELLKDPDLVYNTSSRRSGMTRQDLRRLLN
jgi:SNF2 family DNA or RNA helicase